MWQSLGQFILRYRLLLFIILLLLTGFMAYHAGQVRLSYEFARAIPTDHPKYLAYQEFRKKFGEDGNLLVVGIESKNVFEQNIFNDYVRLMHDVKKVKGVEEMISMPGAINLVRTDTSEKLLAVPVFRDSVLAQQEIDSSKNVFLNLPFYKGLLYNAESGAWLMGVRINGALLNSPERIRVVNNIVKLTDAFSEKHKIDVHLSGLPLIRTIIADRIQKEMRLFLVGSVLLSALILLIFFRSISATLLSLAVVIIGVIWSLGILDL